MARRRVPVAVTGGLLRRLADHAPVAVFAAVGADAATCVDDLLLHPALMRVASPRHADLLLVAGAVRGADRAALRTVHDQIPSPRATVWWGTEAFGDRAPSASMALTDDPVIVMQQLRHALLQHTLESEPDWLPDEPPAPWRGVGPHGQGGKGMMGGTPYGRPMAMTGDDLRDGLALDAFELQVGPYLALWPPGLVLDLVLQGDVLQSAAVVRPPLAERSFQPLQCAARLLALLELSALADRCRQAALGLREGTANEGSALKAAVRRSGALLAIPQSLGRCRIGPFDTGVRDRLAHWLDPVSPSESHGVAAVHPDRLVDLLPGLEWMEAMLVINSFSPNELQSMTAAPAATSATSTEPSS